MPAPLEKPPSTVVVAQKPAGAPPTAPPKRKGGRRVALLLAAAIAVTAGSWFGYHWWTMGRFIVSTDDAYVGADFTAISPRISGYVTAVEAETNKEVKAGDPLVTLDDSDERLAVTAAETQISSQLAAIDRIDRQIDAAKTAVIQAQASISSAQADLDLAGADLKRAQRLKQSDFVSAQALEQANATQEKAQASVETAKAGLTSAQANVAVLAAQRVEAERALDQDRNTLQQKKLDLDRTVIRAPFDGVIGNRNVQAGQFVSPGQRLLALVPLSQIYVDANYKETQLADIHVGAPAEISVDAYDDKPVTGTVESIAPASGAVFSLLPPDNATGNFTKVTQRLAVRIVVPAKVAAESLLRPGMSVVVSIDSRADENGKKVAANQ
ncbi:HlyD family secretion protein [Taklimakanibacter deserti]|uniref:HlyD family secretion protein n=1 Tax=Taklimakanibacter deserti TaxID=2267839 RepID=UPI000E64F169